MERWLVILLSSCSLSACSAQQVAEEKATKPWLELMCGVSTPAGTIGVGAGIPIFRSITVCPAVGIGRAEGMNVSLGSEVHLGYRGITELRGFGYWTYTLGSEDTENGRYTKTIGEGMMLKFGLLAAAHVRTVRLVVRGGYAWFIRTPEVKETNPYVPAITYSATDHYFDGGLCLALGLAIPLGSGH
ncbi:MAG: hypothetical protein IPP33_12715 [Flavobacteriales bacterium]|nr:hypothetical protein [Flavobacteriales bacterium]